MKINNPIRSIHQGENEIFIKAHGGISREDLIGRREVSPGGDVKWVDGELVKAAREGKRVSIGGFRFLRRELRSELEPVVMGYPIVTGEDEPIVPHAGFQLIPM